jgi:hypothetical protein
MGLFRRAGAEILKILQVSSDPTAVAGQVSVYGKDSGGSTKLFMRNGAGVVTEVGTGTGGGGDGIFSPPEMWAQPNVPANQAATPLSAQVSGNNNAVRMTRTGSIVGLSTRLTEAITAGTLTVTVTKNGTPVALALVHTSGTGSQITQAAGIDTYVAGDLIGIQYATNAGFLPITTDLDAWIEATESLTPVVIPPNGARAFKATTVQSIPPATDTVVTFNSEDFDTSAYHDNVTNNSRLTVPSNGVYTVTGRVRFITNGIGLRRIFIRKGGTTILGYAQESAPSGSQPTWLEVSEQVSLMTGEYLELVAHQTTGGNLDIDFDLQNTSFSIALTGGGGGALDSTLTHTFNGTTSTLAAVFRNAAEVATVSATAATGTIAYDVTTQSVLFYTTNAAANWTVNLRASGGSSLDSALSTGQSITVAFLVTQGGTAFFNSAVQVDGTTVGVTTRWQGGTAPSAGNINSVDVYSYTVIKTGPATFTILASQTRFA